MEAQKCGHFILLERQLGHCYEACGETGILKLPGWMKRMAMVSAAVNPGGGDPLSLRLTSAKTFELCCWGLANYC